MRTLRPDALLAVEPGNRRLESGRHQQFDAYRLPPGPDGIEWFEAAAELLDHVAAMAALYRTPDLAELLRPRRVEAPRVRRAPVEPIDVDRYLDDLRHMNALDVAELGAMPDAELVDALRRCVRVESASRPAAGRLVRAARDRGVTLTEVADRLRLSVSTVSRWAQT